MEVIRHHVSDSGKHNQAAVRDLCFVEVLGFLGGKVDSEVHGIKFAEGHNGAGEAGAECIGVGSPFVDSRVHCSILGLLFDHEDGLNVGGGSR